MLHGLNIPTSGRLHILLCDSLFSLRSLIVPVRTLQILLVNITLVTCSLFAFRAIDKLPHKLDTSVYISEQNLFFSLLG